MSKIKKFIDWLLPTTIFFVMEGVNILFPYYPAYITKYGKKARAIVYGYWLTNKPERFYNYLSPELGNIISYTNTDKLVTIFLTTRRGQQESTLYLGNYNQLDNSTVFKKYINLIRYYFYYIAVWMWLDDFGNINGVNKQVFNSDNSFICNEFLGLPIYRRQQLVEKVKLYDSIFAKDYQDPSKKVELNKFTNRLWFVRHQYLYNYLRDKCVRSTYENKYCLGSKNGFVYNPAIDRSCLTIIGYNIVIRRKV